jgi:hypothetical protein
MGLINPNRSLPKQWSLSFPFFFVVAARPLKWSCELAVKSGGGLGRWCRGKEGDGKNGCEKRTFLHIKTLKTEI